MRECDLFVLFLIRLHVLYLEICIALLPECKFGPPLRGWPTKSYKDCVYMRASMSFNIWKLHPANHRGKWACGLTKSQGIVCEMASKGRKCLFPMFRLSHRKTRMNRQHTHLYTFTFSTPDSRTQGSPDKKHACMCRCMRASVCLFYLLTQLPN